MKKYYQAPMMEMLNYTKECILFSSGENLFEDLFDEKVGNL